MTTIKRLIQLQDASRAAHSAFLACEPPDTASESRNFNRLHARYMKSSYTYMRYLAAYMAQTGLGQAVYARSEAAREAVAA